MKQLLTILLFIFLFSSCIPLRIAPKIKDHKIMVAKKFKQKLPRQYAFIFKDPKDADEFYNFINIKFELNHQIVEYNVPFKIDNEAFYLSFYETEIPTKTINLIPIIINAKLNEKGYSPLLEDAEFTRIGNWYLALLVTNEAMEDCLNPNHASRRKVLEYLKDLKEEYVYTHNYLEALLKK